MNAMSEVEAAAGLSVSGADRVPGAGAAWAGLLDEAIPGLLAQMDPTLWGEEAEAEATIRLGWVDTTSRSRAMLPVLLALTEQLADDLGGIGRVVLAGMGGSSLAAEVITRTLGAKLTVLDSTDPGQVRSVIVDAGGELLRRTVVVIASKSGSTVETDAHRRAFWQAFADAGVTGIGRHFVVVTDPGSPLEQTGHELSTHVVLADPLVGGRYSALTAFGLVPAALAGVKVGELLDQADELARSIATATGNPALALGAALGAAASSGRDKLALADDGTGITGLTDWVEQLVAESSGKLGRGILPVVVESPTAAGITGADVLTVTLGGALAPAMVAGGGIHPGQDGPHIAVNGPLGAQFLAWEIATALACRVLGVNPFDQPNVAESKQNTERILASGAPSTTPSFTEGPIEVYLDQGIAGPAGSSGSAGQMTTVSDCLAWLTHQVGPGGYLAIMAYLDRFADADAAQLRPLLAQRLPAAVSFGWGPRFLHSTGQYHKGGPQHGAFLQITGAVAADLPVPGRPYTFGGLQSAQAAGDRQALAQRGRPLLWLHLTDRTAGVSALLEAARRLPPAP